MVSAINVRSVQFIDLTYLALLFNWIRLNQLRQFIIFITCACAYPCMQEERQPMKRPMTSKSSTGTSNGVFDEDIYARMSKVSLSHKLEKVL